MATYRYIIRASNQMIRKQFPELIQAVRVWREAGFTSQDVADMLGGLPLRAVNRVWLMPTQKEIDEIVEMLE